MKRRTLWRKRAIVTGASSGIGRELAVQLAREGVSLVLVARREAELQHLRQSLTRQAAADVPSDRRKAVSVHVVAGDITDAATRDAALRVAREELGGLDLLINNAGTSAHGRFEDASPDALRRIMEVNFFAAAELTRAALPLLREGNEPVVVNVGSILGRRGASFTSDYCASKFALVGWSEAIRPELARHGIGVLVVNPGTTETDFSAHVIEKTAEPPWKRSKGVPASAVARATIEAICRGRNEVVVGRPGRLFVWLNRLAPRLVDRWMERYG